MSYHRTTELQIAEVAVEDAINATASLPWAKWVHLLDDALARNVALKITFDSPETVRRRINHLYELVNADSYKGKVELHRRGCTLYVIPTPTITPSLTDSRTYGGPPCTPLPQLVTAR
jgi:hypothetical protein